MFGYNSGYEEEGDRWAPPEWDEDVDDSVFYALTLHLRGGIKVRTLSSGYSKSAKVKKYTTS